MSFIIKPIVDKLFAPGEMIPCKDGYVITPDNKFCRTKCPIGTPVQVDNPSICSKPFEPRVVQTIAATGGTCPPGTVARNNKCEIPCASGFIPYDDKTGVRKCIAACDTNKWTPTVFGSTGDDATVCYHPLRRLSDTLDPSEELSNLLACENKGMPLPGRYCRRKIMEMPPATLPAKCAPPASIDPKSGICYKPCNNPKYTPVGSNCVDLSASCPSGTVMTADKTGCAPTQYARQRQWPLFYRILAILAVVLIIIAVGRRLIFGRRS